MKENILQLISKSIEAKQELLAQNHVIDAVEKTVAAVVDALRAGKRIYFCGNGGSAADAQHLAAEFTGAFYNRNRLALPAEALHTNTSYLTAAANDFGYEQVYSRLVEGIMQQGDILFGLSTSGNSANIVNAFKAARPKGVITIGMTGENENAMTALSDHYLNMPSNDTPRIQECHLLLGHIICQQVEAAMFSN